MQHTLQIAAGLAAMIAAVAGFAAPAQQDRRDRQSAPCMQDGGPAAVGQKGQGMKHGGGMARMQERMGSNHARMAGMHSRMHGDAGTADKKEDGHKH